MDSILFWEGSFLAPLGFWRVACWVPSFCWRVPNCVPSGLVGVPFWVPSLFRKVFLGMGRAVTQMLLEYQQV